MSSSAFTKGAGAPGATTEAFVTSSVATEAGKRVAADSADDNDIETALNAIRVLQSQMSSLATTFVDYVNTISTNLEVLLRFDETSGATTVDRRLGQTARTGTFSGAYTRGIDSALANGTSKAALSSYIQVNNFTGDSGGTFTYAFIIRAARFQGFYALVSRSTGDGFVVALNDNTTNAQVYVLNNAGTVATSTAAIVDTWKDHLVIVSMGGSTASTRILIDGVLCTGSITTRTVGAASGDRFLAQPTTGEYDPISISAYAEWSRQITPTEEATLLDRCRFNYKPRYIKSGVHANLSLHATSIHQQVVDATKANLNPDMARIDLRWGNIQTSNGGAYDWSRMDSAVDKYLAAGIKLLVTIYGTPTWWTGGSDEASIPVVASIGAWVGDYITFLTAAVTRYKDRVHHWEIWNEPNYGGPGFGSWQSMTPNTTCTATYTPGSNLTVASTAGFAGSGTVAYNGANGGRTEFSYTGKTSTAFTGTSGGVTVYPNGYVQQYTAAQWGTDFAYLCNYLRTAILAADPSAHVCTGGVVAYGYIGNGLSGLALMTAAHNAGLDYAFSHYGIHPYPTNSAGPREVNDFADNFADIRRFRDRLVGWGRGASTIWVTEYGWYYGGDDADQTGTSTKITDSVYDLIHYYSAFVDMFIYFIDFDRPTAGFWGLMTGLTAAGQGTISGAELAVKPVGTAFKNAIAGPR